MRGIVNFISFKSWWLLLLLAVVGVAYSATSDGAPVLLTNVFLPAGGLIGISSLVFLAGKFYMRCDTTNKTVGKAMKDINDTVLALRNDVHVNNEKRLEDMKDISEKLTRLNTIAEHHQSEIECLKKMQENCKFIHRDPFEFVGKD